MYETIEKTYLVILFISFFCSLVSFRLHYPFYLRFFSIFLGITVITELIANFFLPALHLDSNYPVYNVFLLFQLLSVGYYFKLLIKSSLFRKTIIILMILYSIFWISNTLFIYKKYDEPHWNSYASMLGDLLIIIFASRYLFELFTGDKLVSLKRHSEFWIAIGILLFSCCELPITGIVNFLVRDWDLARRLFAILQILNILMYLIFIYAYLCRIKPTVKKSLS